MTTPSGKSEKKTTRLTGLAWRRAVQLRADGASDEHICRVLRCTKGALKAHARGDEILEALVLAEAEADGPHGRRLRHWRLLFAKQIELMAFGKVLEAKNVATAPATPAAGTDKPARKGNGTAAKGEGAAATSQDAAPCETPVTDLRARVDTKVILTVADKIGVFSPAGKRRGTRAHQVYAGLSAADGEDLAGLGELGDWLEAA